MTIFEIHEALLLVVLSAASSATSVFPSVFRQQLAVFKIVMAPGSQAEQNYLVGRGKGRQG